ncbi:MULTISPECIES: hypothetical protein [Prochlorococcus]|uniref:Uncharacterized protein n=1 Tax=Prochlorococcus marinus (strain SARG / CCMP1375 / SS120) TaxID=167539 RepID=Q7VCM5_PROMA|nr:MULTISPECIES: hypothetical protein [Prochlorococcus]AAP99759.1 Predicted protein [Prochlorococcus marinus subsp. marinus str. CCMP1375]KGG14469.1 hypothetical protein EV04_0046 [Prochlorococcus marinus str. LG]KGG22540.1 hypothetical protein EV08_0055 [Prochlorococcus marinus str. SS2]KGG24384.1 hypothetical protein EV09_0291 [Prochlorococcus marinus str. SS35]KGG34156.1 hypothetical protein EV10_0002 [Prochlorococcus marinus str. SS51]
MIKRLLPILIGFVGGLWISWPGIIRNEGWVCAKKIVIQSNNGQSTPIRAALAVPPKYFLNKGSYKGILGKIRIIGDACFR